MMRKLLGLSMMAVAMVGLVAGCGDDDDDKVDDNKIKVAALLTLSGGSYVSRDLQIQEVLAMAADEVNANGGVLGKDLEILIYNTEDQEVLTDKLATAAVEDLGAVALIAGAVGPSDAAADAAMRMEVPLLEIAACASNLSWLADDDWVWRTDVHQMSGFIYADAARDQGWKNIMFFDTNCTETCGGPGMSGDWGGTDHPDEALFLQHIDRDIPVPASYKTIIENALNTMPNPDVIGIQMTPAHGKRLVEDLVALSATHPELKKPFLGCGCTLSTTIEKVMTPEQITEWGGIVHSGRSVWSGTAEHYTAYVDKIKAAHPDFPNYGKCGLPQGWDAVMLFALAANHAGSTDGAALRTAIPQVAMGGTPYTSYAEAAAAVEAGEDIDFQGVSSDLEFNSKGNVPGKEVLKIWNTDTGKRDLYPVGDNTTGKYTLEGLE